MILLHIVIWRNIKLATTTTRPDLVTMRMLTSKDPLHMRGSSYARISESIIANKVGAFTYVFFRHITIWSKITFCQNALEPSARASHFLLPIVPPDQIGSSAANYHSGPVCYAYEIWSNKVKIEILHIVTRTIHCYSDFTIDPKGLFIDLPCLTDPKDVYLKCP